MEQWRYYNHAVIPATAPHVTADTTDVLNGNVWKKYPKALFARWTTDWDCGQETNWWYVICDRPFDISALKASRRYEINKGNKNFDVKRIMPHEYAEQLYRVHIAAVKSYPKKNQVLLTFDEYKQSIKNMESNKQNRFYAAFLKGTDDVCGFIIGTFDEHYFELTTQKADPAYEKIQVNAALVDAFLADNADLLAQGIYCNDGARNINHETAFQDYLEKYFCFRKAYCKLHIVYRPGFGLLIKFLFPFRKMLMWLDNIPLFHQVNGVLKMEEIVRKDR